VVLAVLFGGVSFAVSAEQTKTGNGKEIGTFELKYENDMFSGQDQNYTNGVRFSYLSPEGNTFEPLQDILDFLNEKTNPSSDKGRKKTRTSRIGLALGHEIYTPEDRYRTDLITDDRPYSAWLYGGMSVHMVTDWKNSERKHLETI
jgi:hypothetical protein